MTQLDSASYFSQLDAIIGQRLDRLTRATMRQMEKQIVARKKPIPPETLDQPPSFQFRTEVGERQVYDWERLFDGGSHVLKRGREFDLSIKSMRDQIYGAAKRNGFKVTVRKCGESLVVTREPENKTPGATMP